MLNKKNDNQAAPNNSKGRKAGDARKASKPQLVLSNKAAHEVWLILEESDKLGKAARKISVQGVFRKAKQELIASGMRGLDRTDRLIVINGLDEIERYLQFFVHCEEMILRAMIKFENHRD